MILKRTIFKTTGFFALSIFVLGILFFSVRDNQVQAYGYPGNDNQSMGHMMKNYYADLPSEQQEEMINLMQNHHGDNWQDHHQQMHGSKMKFKERR